MPSRSEHNPTGVGERPLEGRPGSIGDAAWELAVDAATVEVVAALDESGIRSLLIKGPAITCWLYDRFAARGYNDIDLLVSPTNWSRAVEILTRLGFESAQVNVTPEEASALIAEGRLDHHAEM